MEVSTSILNAKDRIKTVFELNNSKTDYIHFDVMDGKFVQNKQFCIPELVKLLSLSTKKNDVHLMVEDPMKYLKQIINLKIDQIIIHVEIDKNIREILNFIKKKGIKCGLAVDLDTDISMIEPYLDLIDTVLIMSVKAGLGGQTFNEKTLDKIKMLDSKLTKEIDGGIDDITAKKAHEFDILVSGTYILKDIKNNIDLLK